MARVACFLGGWVVGCLTVGVMALMAERGKTEVLVLRDPPSHELDETDPRTHFSGTSADVIA